MSRIPFPRYRRTPGSPGRRSKGRLWIALVIAGVSIVSFLMTRSKNPITGQTQYVAMSVQDEIALGLQAAPEMAAQHGGLHPDTEAQALVDEVGNRLLARGLTVETPYQFEFHLLADPQTVNAFALPGGQVFITAALFSQLETEGQLAGVIGHEIGHVIERHGAERLAKMNLTQGLVGAVGVAASEEGRGYQAAAVAAAIGQLVNMRYGRDDELECDRWGVKLMADAGYDPRAQIRVMEILRDAGGGGGPEFFSTHPNPENRIGRIERAIEELFPNGVPEGLVP
ncbi:MAG TPA: M48 family metalloprotease [Phycisphaerales bacterium]|nr:M48 family metalloprotease [Phycisphaerales bacterium]